MACGLTAGRRGNKNRGYQNILSCGGRESDGWIFRTVIRQSRLLRICGGSEVVTRFFQASSQSSHTHVVSALTVKAQGNIFLRNARFLPGQWDARVSSLSTTLT